MVKSLNPLYINIANELNLGEISSVEVIQSLWGGYGELVRLHCLQTTVIVKHVKLPKPAEHPKGWNTDLSHQRKLHSYEVEVNWYENFSQVDNRCRIPQGLKCFQTENEWLIVMEDLGTIGFTEVVKEPTKNHLISCLKWLANFHAKYINTNSTLLWKTGTYWHLETRPDELEAMEDLELKSVAQRLDEKLKRAKFQTIVHGDAKLANFCFNKEGSCTAAVDFQYVGQGCAMKDVALFMSSAVKPEACKKMESWVLETYFNELEKALQFYQPDLSFEEVKNEWLPMFSVAWADFQRFLKGWSPNHWKINDYSQELTKRVLRNLKDM